MTKRVVMLLGVLALCVSCQKFAEGRQMFHDLLVLRDEVGKEFDEKVVDVSLSGSDKLVIKFIDSPLQAASREEKQKRADMVAAFVMKRYKHPLSSVSTQFVAKNGPISAGETYAGHPMP